MEAIVFALFSLTLSSTAIWMLTERRYRLGLAAGLGGAALAVWAALHWYDMLLNSGKDTYLLGLYTRYAPVTVGLAGLFLLGLITAVIGLALTVRHSKSSI